MTLIGCGVAPTASSPANEVASLQAEPQAQTQAAAELQAAAESAPEVPSAPPTLTGERETLRACMARLADTWEQPLAYRRIGEDPETSSEEWRLEDGAGRALRLRLFRDSTSVMATAVAYGDRSVHLTQSPSDLRDLASQATRLEFGVMRHRAADDAEWSAVEEVANDARACRRRLLAHGRRHLREVQQAPAEEQCALVRTRDHGCFRSCTSRRTHVHEARLYQRELAAHTDELCAAIASVRDALECFPTAALAPSSSED
jgi:hypothetical protein